MNVAIITDTNSGIHKELAEELGIFVVPMPIIIENTVFFEETNLSADEYYTALSDFKEITTSQPSLGNLVELWDSLLKNNYDEIVYIPMSSALSTSCSASTAYSLEYEGAVQVVDNHRISVTLRESVLYATKLAQKGYSAKQIKETLEADAYNAYIYLAVNTLDYLKRGGRVTPAAAMISSVLSIRPILTIRGGKIDSFLRTRGSMKKTFSKMLDAVTHDINTKFSGTNPSLFHIGIAGANLAPAEINNYLLMASERFPSSDIYYNPLSASISCHTGPGALGIGISCH